MKDAAWLAVMFAWLAWSFVAWGIGKVLGLDT